MLDLNPNQSGVYFSIDGGTTSLRVYNDGSNGGDDKDWASGQIPANDSFNAFGTLGAKEDMSVADMKTMDVIGYNLVPEPGSATLLGLAIGCLVLRNRARLLNRWRRN